MDLRTLEYVEAICRLGTFTAAARALHVAQPAVSAQIAGLERRLGTALFIRTSTGARPTELGLLVAERARRLRGELNALQEDIDSLAGLTRGTLRIGATPLLGRVDLPHQVAKFRSEHPAVNVRIRTALIGELLSGLDNGDLDLIVGPLDGVVPARHQATILHDVHLLLVTPVASPIRTLASARERRFICLPPGSGLRRLLDVACAVHGFVPQVDVEVTDPHLIPPYIRAGLGVGVVAASIAEPDEELCMTPLTEGPTHPPFGVITGPVPSRAALAFSGLLISNSA